RAATAQNATRLSATLAALHKAVGSGGEIKTTSYSLNPEYQYHPNGGRTLTGFTANNVVRVTLNDLGKVGSVIDAATLAGANEVQDVRFTLSDQQPVRAQALREAVLRAKADAGVLAAALDLKVTRVISVEVPNAGAAGMEEVVVTGWARRTVAAQAPTPIQPGTIDVMANVVLTVEVSAAPR
ncbi:MAG: SIMPL domain-containing protein, partial [Steroidobacteraceae bacterium]